MQKATDCNDITPYRVNEIFYSLQGEGHFTGVPAVFIRLSGCNLACPFCDTRHQKHETLTARQIIEKIAPFPSRHCVITGGEPSLQNLAPLVDALHADRRFVQIETNGTHPLPSGIDWVTCSPKGQKVELTHIDELKLLFLPEYLDGATTPDQTARLLLPEGIEPREYRLQPCDTGEPFTNSQILDATVRYIKHHPHWSLSLQTHKLISIP